MNTPVLTERSEPCDTLIKPCLKPSHPETLEVPEPITSHNISAGLRWLSCSLRSILTAAAVL